MRIIDVSSNNHFQQRPIAWNAVARSGVEGVLIKATEGVGYVNPWFARDLLGARNAGLRCGAYHFARFDMNDAGAEARHFLRITAGHDLELPDALDLETGTEVGWGRLGWQRDEWLRVVEDAGRQTCVYVNRWFLDHLPNGVNGRRLWLADPQVSPSVPCWLWQMAPRPVPGIVGLVDVNELIGPLTGPAKEDEKVKLNQPIVGPPIYTMSGDGYWLVAGDGGIFSFGDADVFTDNPLPNLRLNAPITGAAVTRTGHGLLLVGADGGVFAVGDARSLGGAN